MHLNKKLRTAFLIICIIIVIILLLLWKASSHADILWRIVSQQCIPNQIKNGQPSPCSVVDLKQGFVLYKDENGSLQYLLMPTQKITGIESPKLLNPSEPNYFAEAWQNRTWLSKRYGKPIPDRLLSLTINSEYGRTQNQLHIHISCTKPKVLSAMQRYTNQLSEHWSIIQNGINTHVYWARKLSAQELEQKSPFIWLAEGLSHAPKHMGHYGLALLPTADGNFILLMTKHKIWSHNRGSIEEIQDHSCSTLYPTHR